MRNKYLLLGAASALMLAACSEDINNGPDAPKPVENALNLTSLSPASQAGRVSLPGQTRGLKANRLQLVAKIAPLSDAATKHWSATGIAIANGNAYVSWHSDHQASTPATAWGGAVDEISIAALDERNLSSVITNTLTSDGVKFNNVFANGSDLYFPLTCYKAGAVVGKLAIGAQAMDTIRIPGSSANAIEVNGGTLTAVTGYKGGAYSLSAGFNADGGSREVATIVEDEAFGGKFVVNGKILRTNATESFLYDVENKSEVSLGAPLLSETKFAEKYDGETGTWENVGTQAQYYGKHTMAIDGDIIYVGGGQGDNGENGLRVYDAAGDIKWQNGTNTTSVCVDGNYVYAATGAGLRVYEKFNGTELPLYAFEVLDYDADGNAADHPGDNKPVAGTDAHSSNFVAVGGGYIFVANGQDGVYVFKLNENAVGNTRPAGFEVPSDPSKTNVKDVDEGDSDKFAIPDAPEDRNDGSVFVGWKDNKKGLIYKPGDEDVTLEAGDVRILTPIYKVPTGFIVVDDDQTELVQEDADPIKKIVPPAPTAPEGQEFGGWKDEEGNVYTPGEEEEFPAGKVIKITPIWNEKVYTYTVTFDLNGGTGTVPAAKEVKSDNPYVEVPAQGDITRDGFIFQGWAEKSKVNMDDTIYKPGDKCPVERDMTLYAVWGKQGSVTGTPDAEGDEL